MTDLKAKRIFELLLGMYDLKKYSPPEAEYVENLFRPGQPCAMLLDRAYAARWRVGARLGTGEEDADLLELVESYEALWEKLGLAMYEYGKRDGTHAS